MAIRIDFKRAKNEIAWWENPAAQRPNRHMTRSTRDSYEYWKALERLQAKEMAEGREYESLEAMVEALGLL